MPRTKQQYEDIRDATREKIIASATSVFVRKGFAAAGVQDIADGAGVSAGLIYRHFKSKEELFSRIVEQAAEGLERLAEAFESEAPPKDLFDEFASEIYHDIAGGDAFAELLCLITHALFTSGRVDISFLIEADSRMIRAAERLIRRGQEEGVFAQGDPGQLAAHFFASVQGLGLMKLAMKEDFVMPSREILTRALYVDCAIDVNDKAT